MFFARARGLGSEDGDSEEKGERAGIRKMGAGRELGNKWGKEGVDTRMSLG